MSEYQSIADRVGAIPRVWKFVRVADVVAIVKDVIPVEIDSTMYDDDHPLMQSQRDREILAVTSTAYNLMADTAARFAAEDLRKSLEGQGKTGLPSDEEIFESLRDDPEAAHSYRDLAPRDEETLMAVAGVFFKLMGLATSEAFQAAEVANEILDMIGES